MIRDSLATALRAAEHAVRERARDLAYALLSVVKQGQPLTW